MARSKLRVGMAEVVITPPVGIDLVGYFQPRKSVGVHDDLMAKSVVFDDGKTQAAIVSCDLVSVGRDLVQAIRKEAQKLTRIPGEHILVHGTHTHTGPRATYPPDPKEFGAGWREGLPQRIAGAIRAAKTGLQRARIGWSAGEAHGVSFYRRYRTKDGLVITNPASTDKSIVGPVGSIDPQVQVVRIERDKGGLMGVIVNFGVHPDMVGGCWLSAGYPYYVARAVKSLEGADVPVLFLNAPCGNLNHYDISRPLERGQHVARRAGTVIGAEAAKVLQLIETKPGGRVTADTKPLRIPLRKFSAKQVEAAEKRMKTKSKGFDSRRMFAERISETAKRPEETVDTEIQCISVGEVAFAGFPCEYFKEFGEEVKQESPFAITIPINLANDSIGYVPTIKAFKEGDRTWNSGKGEPKKEAGEAMGFPSYETLSSQVDPGGGELMAKESLELLRRLTGR